MKRIRTFISVALLLVTLTGCGNEKTQSNNSQANNDTVTEASTNKIDNNRKSNTNTNNNVKDKESNIKKDNTANKVNSNNNSNSNTAVNNNSENNATTVQSENNITTVQNEESFYGQWVIEKEVAYCKVASYSNDDIKKIVGKKLSFSKEQSSCFGDDLSYINDTVKNPNYKKSVITSDEFLNNWGVPIKDLTINGNTVTEVEIDDAKDLPACTFFIKDDNTLILYGGGIFFQLSKVKSDTNSANIN
ncbi:hypothetical protein [Clostridium taeniosporum]|uniref:Lipoprotein n=1 Tax=Clostridium taeniosporum TaxID=394958 RepID=A0A1D7XP19_9CLOT|nr:hypothetical protein [Clostridium taeniosporum]AOR25037.1 hypothetical protein BGI42_14925 [Clostridium taeniosporum]